MPNESPTGSWGTLLPCDSSPTTSYSNRAVLRLHRKLNMVRLKIKKFKLDNSLTDAQLNDKSEGLDLLIEEQQLLHEIDELTPENPANVTLPDHQLTGASAPCVSNETRHLNQRSQPLPSPTNLPYLTDAQRPFQADYVTQPRTNHHADTQQIVQPYNIYQRSSPISDPAIHSSPTNQNSHWLARSFTHGFGDVVYTEQSRIDHLRSPVSTNMQVADWLGVSDTVQPQHSVHRSISLPVASPVTATSINGDTNDGRIIHSRKPLGYSLSYEFSNQYGHSEAQPNPLWQCQNDTMTRDGCDGTTSHLLAWGATPGSTVTAPLETSHVNNESNDTTQTNTNFVNERLVQGQQPAPRLIAPRPGAKQPKHGVTKASQAARPKNSTQRRRKQFTIQAREETALRRILGACQGCHVDKIKCLSDPRNPDGPCLKCVNKLNKYICINWKIANVSLYRDQACPWPEWTARYKDLQRAEDIKAWASDEIKALELSHGIEGASYYLRVKQFVPQQGDNLFQTWFDETTGTHKKHVIQPYAVVSLRELKDAMTRYIQRHVASFIKHVIGNSDGIVWRTYWEAFRRAGDSQTNELEKDLLAAVLQLWVSSRFASMPETICGEEKIAQRIDDPSSPYHGTYPVAPVIYAQEETVMLKMIQRPLQEQVMFQLDRLMKVNKMDSWFTIYLTLFILAHSCTLTSQRDAEYAREVRAETLFANPDAIDVNQYGVRKLIYHFHHDNKGSLPFESALNPNGADELARNAHLNSEQLELVKETADWAKHKQPEFQAAQTQNDTTHHLYFISQLFNPNHRV